MYCVIPLVFACGIVEGIASTLYVRGTIEPEPIWLIEDTGPDPTIQFDPISGYRITATPSRMACIASNGFLDSVGTVRGNNMGFPDRDNFRAKRTDPRRRRYAVFGDSFSAAQYLKKNWPDKVEDLTRDAEQPIELLNLSVDGGGIINWWSVLTRIVDKQDFELDGIIFAVYGDDLKRGFTVWDDRVYFDDPTVGQRFIGCGRIPIGADLPSNLGEAMPYIHPIFEARIVPTPQFERVLRGDENLFIHRPFALYLTARCLQTVNSLIGGDAGSDPYGDEPANLIDADEYLSEIRIVMSDIREFSERTGIPVTVVEVPSVYGLLDGSAPSLAKQRFAENVGATFVDGAKAFASLQPDAIRKCWLRYDGHWGQIGSDHFAKFMSKLLTNGPKP